jgi:iron complex transport system ATP-binding protein
MSIHIRSAFLALVVAVVFAAIHDLNLAAQYADRLIVLHNKHVLRVGTPREVLVPGVLKQAFGVDIYVVEHRLMDAPRLTNHPHCI